MKKFIKVLFALTLSLGLDLVGHAQWTPPGGGGGGSSQGPHQYEGGELYKMTSSQTASLPSVTFGDSWNQDTGAASFSQTDISIPGNNDMPVAITRTRSRNNIALFTDGMFGDWELSLPRIEYSWRKGAAEQYFEATRCRSPRPSNLYGSSSNGHIPYAFFFGMSIYGFEGNGELIMEPNSTWPSAALGSAPTLTTKSLWKISCLPNATNGHDGFLAVAPNGTTYRFDREIHRRTNKTVLENIQVSIYPSVVTDVHGNTVTYTYNSHGPTRIESSDGRVITLSYNGAGQITQVQANGRSWTYTYTSESYNYNPITNRTLLSKVRRPDNKEWVFSGFKNLDWANTPERDLLDCSVLPNWGGIGWRPPHSLGDVTVTHPNGSRLVLKLRATKNGRTGGAVRTAPNYWYTNRCRTSLYNLDNYFVSLAIDEKRYELADGPVHTWQYTYEEDEGAYSNQSHLANIKKRSVLQPDGSRFEVDINRITNSQTEGNIEQRRTYANASTNTPLETQSMTLDPSWFTQTSLLPLPYNSPAVYGSSAIRAMVVRPTRQIVTARGSDTFTTTNTFVLSNTSTFSHANPTRVARTSNLGHGTRTTDLTYQHKTSSWVLFLPSVEKLNNKEFSRFTYDSDGQVTQWKQFGAVWRTYTWASDGTMATSKDGLNRQTTYSNYKRGYPRSVTQPDNTTFSFAVDNNGWITSATNPRGFTTSLSYNSMGWLTNVNRPSPWADTSVSYAWGSGGITTTETRGNHRLVTTHDGMNRPVLVRTADLSGNAPSVYTKTTYDGLGRTTFTSFPSTSANPTTGVDTSYDGLGRVVQLRENVSPYATTSTSYLVGHKIRVTDPVGAQTTTTYRAFGVPTFNEPSLIQQPESMTTSLSYDSWGNLTAAAQGGFTQTWTYDSRLRLCNHFTQEQGGSVFAYNNANEISYTALGQGNGCSSNSADRIHYTYDAMGRQTLINYPSGTPDIAVSYDANGNMIQNSRGGVVWTYVYNSLDLTTEEKVVLDSRTYRTQYVYDNNANLSTQTTPGNNTIVYAPNGLGQATKASVGSYNYASNATYHPNGAIKQMSFGNTRGYTSTLNARQLTSQIHYWSGFTHNFSHDANGRISAIDDVLDSSRDRSYSYDLLGRLKTANGEWGGATFTYDARNNLTRKQLGSRVVEIQFNSKNQVSRARDTADGNTWQSYAHDTRGNVTDNGPINFTYDAAMQPVAIFGAESAAFTYDGLFSRVKQIINGETIYSVYGAGGVLLYRDNTTTGETTDYIRISGMLVAEITNGTKTYLYQDQSGSPIKGAETANVTWNERYTPFGEKWSTANQGNDQIGFTGHISDTDTGLTYMQARYYDPVIGRFLSPDPVGFMNAGPSSFNRYLYPVNDPINATDPTGMYCENRDNGTYVCDPPGDEIGEYTVPSEVIEKLGGYMPDIGPDFANYHEYTATTSAPESSDSFVEKVEQEVINDPTPGNDNPATPGGTFNDAGINPVPQTDTVVSFTATDSNGNLVVSNITVPGKHMLGPAGIVHQGVSVEGRFTKITAVGEGHALLSRATNSVARQVFQQKIDGDMRAAIFKHHQN